MTNPTNNHWETLAEESDRMADWERQHGRYSGVYEEKARTYRAAANANELETSTGKPHCVCCLMPKLGK